MRTDRPSSEYEAILAFAREIVAGGTDAADADAILDAQADLVMHACLEGYEDEYDPELDCNASEDQCEEAVRLAQALDEMHSVLWNRANSGGKNSLMGAVRRRR